ncbi:folate-binding protein [Defluviimonas sp. WL0024]|uniref:Folate-binding protein n=1 Tax=Albidovulum salinarum TaxID=2984153 RepID=A0ABT2X570_9RHOB|nr:folate-binding protein [Defluviimonas sp. WL0024]MCU9849093.1 folate-binding protein [Defluviimonas sp. WL0024]
MTGEAAPDRRVFEIAGRDAKPFLQGLVTNDLGRLSEELVYAALLSPQGKYLADFFLVPDGDRILLDAHATQAEALGRRLAMYRLRAEVTITLTDLKVTRGLGDAPEGAYADPRHPALGWRRYGTEAGGAPQIDWDAIRVAQCIPETGIELIPEESYILEAGFERLNGVDFRKGCYVGQEVTARMKHKTELRKGLTRVTVDGEAPAGTEITAEGKPVGRLFTRSGDHAIAYLRLDRAGGEMRAGAARIVLA